MAGIIEQHEITGREEWLRWRRQDVTASSAAALLGAHPYQTAFGVWAEKTGAVVPDDDMTEAMDRGIELEPLAIKRLAKLRPEWKVWQPNIYYRDPLARLGATPDCFVESDRGRGVIQIKSVEPMRFRKDWRSEDGSVEPPMYAVVQAIVEAHLTGATWAAVAALVISHGIELHPVEVPLHAGIIERVRAEVAAFWRLVDEGRKPEADFGRDARLIEALYAPDSEEILDLSHVNSLPELLDERASVGSRRSMDEKRLKEIKGQLLVLLGRHSLARVADGRLISAKTVQRKGFTVEPTEYIDVKVRKGIAA